MAASTSSASLWRVVETGEAVADGVVRLHEALHDNLAFDYEYGWIRYHANVLLTSNVQLLRIEAWRLST